MKYIHIVLLMCLMMIPAVNAEADDESTSAADHRLALNLRPSFILPSHGFYNGWNPSGHPLRAGGTLDVQYSFSFPDRSVYQGIGTAVHTFLAHEMLGTPVTIYILQGAPLASLSERLSIGYEWNLGISAGWKKNDIVTSSYFNIYLNIAMLFAWHIGKYTVLTFGPEYTHFSNGDTSFPNGGANTVNLRLGARVHLKPYEAGRPEKIFSGRDKESGPAERMAYDLTLTGGWRADRSGSVESLVVDNRPFPMAAMCFNPLYRFNNFLAAGAALEFVYDHSANIGSDFLSQSALGLSARAELKMPVFAINVGVGYSHPFLIPKGTDKPELSGFYTAFSLKAFLSSRLFLNISYRLNSIGYSHNLTYGLGWRFGKE